MPKMFDIKPQVLKTPEQAYAELLGSSEENQIVDIDINLIDEIDEQPQKIHNDKISRIAESMKIVGQLDPCLVIPNPKKKGRYLLLAGRHRKRACLLNGADKIKAVIKKEKDPDKQRLMLLATNNDRNTDYSPSELAFSYKEQMELLKKLGSKSTASQIAQENNTNRKTVHKYIQLTKLISPLLSRVDNNTITVGAGYELSFLTSQQQTKVFNFLLNHSDCRITKENAREIRLAPDDLQNIFYPLVDKPTLIEDNEEKADTEEPKAEKKINSDISKNVKCPSEGHLQNNIIPFEILMTVASILYKETYSIFEYIISKYATTSEVVMFIKTRYIHKTQFEGTLSSDDRLLKYVYYDNSGYDISFKNKLSVKIKDGTTKGIKYNLSYEELDKAIRGFIRKFLSIEDIIPIIKEGMK